jgi:hypothetical protein
MYCAVPFRNSMLVQVVGNSEVKLDMLGTTFITLTTGKLRARDPSIPLALRSGFRLRTPANRLKLLPLNSPIGAL